MNSNQDDPQACGRCAGASRRAVVDASGRSETQATAKEHIIANLMAPGIARPTFAALDSVGLRRCEERLASASALWNAHPGTVLEGIFADELEELEMEVSGIGLEALLDRIDGARTEALDSFDLGGRSAPPTHPLGRFLVHRFGDSLETGEAEVAARGFFDIRDRPPISLWLEALSRPLPRRPGAFEVSVLVFVPQDQVLLAEAGRAACESGALFFLDEDDGELKDQLTPLLERRAC